MRKALFAFLLVLLPLQFVWGAAAAYCQHEATAAAGHFGHHSHRHADGATSDNAKSDGARSDSAKSDSAEYDSAEYDSAEYNSAKSDSATAAPDESGAPADPVVDDPDCGVCHLSCVRPIASEQRVQVDATAQPPCALAPPAATAAPPSRIERPQRLLAA